jgi:hypothetical protein
MTRPGLPLVCFESTRRPTLCGADAHPCTPFCIACVLCYNIQVSRPIHNITLSRKEPDWGSRTEELHKCNSRSDLGRFRLGYPNDE